MLLNNDLIDNGARKRVTIRTTLILNEDSLWAVLIHEGINELRLITLSRLCDLVQQVRWLKVLDRLKHGRSAKSGAIDDNLLR